MTARTPGNHAVLYVPIEGFDASPGRELLMARGVEVLDLSGAPTSPQLENVVALMAGYDHVGAGLLDRLPALRLIATHSTGFDMVDLDEARARGLWVANVPGASTEEVAVHALAMALALLRRLPAYDRAVRQGRWTNESESLPRLPRQLTCGVLGMGRIGQAFAALAHGVFGRVVGYDPLLPAGDWPAGVGRTSEVDTLFAQSDCISLHLPLTDGTRGLVDARLLALLPSDAVVVNVSRGELVDEPDLLAALQSGRLAGAACDVIVHEPPTPEDPMLHDERILLSPHVAYLSAGSSRRYAEVPARNVLALLDHGAPLTPVISGTV